MEPAVQEAAAEAGLIRCSRRVALLRRQAKEARAKAGLFQSILLLDYAAWLTGVLSGLGTLLIVFRIRETIW
jgi:hypothetical protein